MGGGGVTRAPGDVASSIVYDRGLTVDDRIAKLEELAEQHPVDPEVTGYFETLAMQKLAMEELDTA